MNSELKAFLDRVKSGQPVDFQDTISVITKNYQYTPTRFSNGSGSDVVVNDAGTNEGSCKIFGFARLHGLNEADTLGLFGDYYRKDVLENSEGQDHRNIRNFMKYGWAGIQFDGEPLSAVE